MFRSFGAHKTNPPQISARSKRSTWKEFHESYVISNNKLIEMVKTNNDDNNESSM